MYLPVWIFNCYHERNYNFDGCEIVHHQFQDVAVKILMEQDFHAERVNEFLREVHNLKLSRFFLVTNLVY